MIPDISEVFRILEGHLVLELLNEKLNRWYLKPVLFQILVNNVRALSQTCMIIIRLYSALKVERWASCSFWDEC